MFRAKPPDLIVDLVSDVPRLFHFFLGRASERRWVGEGPMQPRCHAGKDRTRFRFGFIANSDDVSKQFTRLVDVKDSSSLIFRDVCSDLLQDRDGQRIQFARFEPGTVCFEKLTASLIQQSGGHLAASAVVHANKQDFLFHRLIQAQQLSGFPARLRSRALHVIDGGSKRKRSESTVSLRSLT